MRENLNIPHKANRVLNLVILAFLLILLRVWYLGFIQGDYHQKQARKPQRRTSLEKVDRATIRDRFNIPLAQNTLSYAAAIRYADIREIPSHEWVKEDNGKKVKKPKRASYISSLASKLSEELSMPAQEIEDTIYAKASLFPHTPFVIKESLSEKEYYRLRMLQKDWVGIEAQRNTKRVYPLGKTAGDIIGYMGAISAKEYLFIAQEIKELEEYIRKRESGDIVFLPPGYEDPLAVRKRLAELKQKAYPINDSVGKTKTGIEKTCDEILRGVHGKKIVEIDPKGNVIRELPGTKKGDSGERIFLSISSELQEYAESLLAHHEIFRNTKDPGVPWIKGGSIVALDPKTGEVLALASYPRINPNDFVQTFSPFFQGAQQKSLHKWMESETHIGEIWEGKTPLKRETYSWDQGWSEESTFFSWSYFLNAIISPKSSLLSVLKKIDTIQNAYLLDYHFQSLLKQANCENPIALMQALYPEGFHIPCKKKPSLDTLAFITQNLLSEKEALQESRAILDTFFLNLPCNDDKLLALDLIRLLIVTDRWTPEVLEKMGSLSLSSFFELTQSLSLVQEAVKEKAACLHHNLGFKQWREKYFKSFLAKKRKEEKERKTYARPYTEYLEKLEKALFKSFWNTCQHLFLDAAIHGKQRIDLQEYPELQPYVEALESLSKPFLLPHLHKLQSAFSALDPVQTITCLKTMRGFQELNRPLYGKYRLIRNVKGVSLEKHLASAFYPLAGFGYGRSQAFRQTTPQGSVFKLVVAYEALKERYEYIKENLLSMRELNPLTLIDEMQRVPKKGAHKQILGYTLDGRPIERFYKGGVIPRGHPGIGKIDLPQAIEQSSNTYFSILAAEHIADPSLLERATKDFGFGAKTGIGLQGEIAGTVPDDLADNKTGLYSFAIGQHSLVVTPLQTTVMLATLGNGGNVLKPQIIRLTAGKNRVSDPFSFDLSKPYPFQDSLALMGIYFPLFSEALSHSYDPCINEVKPEVVRSLFFPPEIRQILFEGMNKVVAGNKGTAKPSIIKYLQVHPKIAQTYQEMQKQLIGKTGTAEILYKQYLDSESKAEIHNHIWFGGLVFPEGTTYADAEPEIAIAVYLRFSQSGGKEAAPLAALVAKKWREIQKKQNLSP
jgi:cell division protein FtsI/penicillin-binding protein 2